MPYPWGELRLKQLNKKKAFWISKHRDLLQKHLISLCHWISDCGWGHSVWGRFKGLGFTQNMPVSSHIGDWKTMRCKQRARAFHHEICWWRSYKFGLIQFSLRMSEQHMNGLQDRLLSHWFQHHFPKCYTFYADFRCKTGRLSKCLRTKGEYTRPHEKEKQRFLFKQEFIATQFIATQTDITC